MLRVRDQQVRVIECEKQSCFVDSMCLLLREFLGSRLERASPPILSRWVTEEIGRAAFWGITSEHDLGRYLALRVMFGAALGSSPRFERVRAILGTRVLDGTTKLDMIEEDLFSMEFRP